MPIQYNVNHKVIIMRRSVFVLMFIHGLTINLFSQVDTISNNIYQFNGKLGIGTSYPSSGFTLKCNEEINYPTFGIMNIMNNHYATFDGYSASDIHYVGSLFNGRRARGTVDFPENVMAGDRLTGIISSMYYDNAFRFNSSILFYAGQGLGYDSYPSYIVFNTTAANEAIYTERMRLAGNGYLSLGTTGPASKLHIADGDIYIADIDRGIIMKSPDGQCWRGVMDNSGMLNFSPVDCPENTVSAESVPMTEVNIFPNPAIDNITVEVGDSHQGGMSYTICDVNGKLIQRGMLKTGASRIDISKFSDGVYFINILNNLSKSIASRQFIKN